MKQTFDPFAEPLTESPQSESPVPSADGRRTWTPPEEGLVEQLARTLRRRKWLVLSAIVLVPLAAFLYSHHQETQYTATANLYFNDPTVGVINSATSNVTVDPTRQAATNSSLVTLPIVATYASRETGGRIPPAAFTGAISVDGGSGDSDVVAIHAMSGSPQQAAQMANAYGQGYITFRRTSDRDALQTNINQLQAQYDNMTPDEQNGAQGRRIQGQIQALGTAQALRTGDAELVQPASAPTSPSSPKTRRNVIIGLFVGVVLGLALAGLLERLDRRIRTEEDLERIYGLPVLAQIPRSRALGRGKIGVDTAEPFRSLRTNLRYVNFDHRLHSLLVASPLPEDGKSTIARALATTMASMGDDVVLVDMDLHKARNGSNAFGLSNVLIGDSLDDALVTENVPTGEAQGGRPLTVLPAGPMPPNPSELVDSDRMRDVLHELERRFELVILDAPALAQVADGLALVPMVSGILVVGGVGRTTQKAAMDLRRQLALLHGRTVGLAANFTQTSGSRYGYGRRRYGYGR